ncbi:hypothetical protein HMPREF0294_1442 [Corynebacterium glucuronolyticum ATCC 51867]|nr:hypothetical protein HMPREF0294_1442 [Corynebacterium glucuronolyticum ATCC 51867]
MRECEDLIQRFLEVAGNCGETLIAELDDLLGLIPGSLSVGLLEDGIKDIIYEGRSYKKSDFSKEELETLIVPERLPIFEDGTTPGN